MITKRAVPTVMLLLLVTALAAVMLTPTSATADADTDGDGLSDADELLIGTDPNNPDTDDDYLTDGYEVSIGTDPLDEDTDDDLLEDGEDIFFGYDPLLRDSDGDGLFDAQDLLVDSGYADSDGDGLLDVEEIALHDTDPLDPDTDDDGKSDGAERPLCPRACEWTDPLDPDTDDDGLLDGEEVTYGTRGTNPDTDGDGLGDAIEAKAGLGTDPTNSDTDGDGILDGADVEWLQASLLRSPGAAFKHPAARNLLMNRLDDAETEIQLAVFFDAIGAAPESESHRDAALEVLHSVGERMDGCGTTPDTNDWLINCGVQIALRQALDLLVENVEGI